ncbi:hypothetical protein NE865_14722 [Phthorimaea operculella]|nr:hypothetical protein NE865_14722 [Phthorimaea operculella]
MFVYGERPGQCPVVGPFEDTYGMQCPMESQWQSVPFEPQVQCYRDFYPQYLQNPYPQTQYYAPQVQPIPPVVQPQPQPMFANLPCHQQQPWDYNSMCYNVDGQPCQYTNVVDLEDFM